MKNYTFPVLLAVFLTGTFFVLSGQALAGEVPVPQDVAAVAPGNGSTPVTGKNMPAYLDAGLANKHTDFSQFANSRVHSLNRNHNLSKSRMQITRQADGSYIARYHRIDTSTVICKVSRSSSKTVPYVGVLRYHEMVMEAVADSPEACRQAEFAAIAIIPNRQIFSFKKGTWQ